MTEGFGGVLKKQNLNDMPYFAFVLQPVAHRMSIGKKKVCTNLFTLEAHQEVHNLKFLFGPSTCPIKG